MDEPLTVRIGGKRFEGWTSVDVRLAIDAVAGAFEVGMTDRWDGQPDRWEIETAQSCEVLIGGQPVLTGAIDVADWEEDEERHPITISGRGKTADLLDCSAVHTPGSWTGRRLEQIARELTAPFGIGVLRRANTGAPFPRFALNQGETVHEALERMGRLRGVIFTESAAGELEIITPGEQAAGYALIEGENLRGVGFRNDATERFSQYIVKGYAGGQDGPAARPKAEAEDKGVPRYRPTIMVDGEQGTAAGMKLRAQWEATVRAARGQTARGWVVGWRSNGELHRPNRLVKVKAPYIGVDQELLISAVKLIEDGRGRRTEFELVRKEAFSPEPLAEEKPKKGRGVKPLTRK